MSRQKKSRMKKYILFPLTVLAAIVAASCSDGRFSIEGKLSDAGTQNLQAIYLSGDSLISAWVPSVDGTFRFEGNSEQLTVVYIFSSQKQQIAHVAARNGDEITLSGSIKDNRLISVDGTETNKAWSGFINTHAADFKAMDSKKTDKAIAGFVRKNPENVVSTLLLTCDYSDPGSAEASRLLGSVADKAKPEQLTALYNVLLSGKDLSGKKLTDLSLRNEKDSLVLVKTGESPLSVVYFWKYQDNDRKTAVDSLKRLAEDKRVKVLDICLDSDTLNWRETIERDSSGWKHYKALAGQVDRTIVGLDVKGSPFFIVADSAGTQLYRGQSVEKACSTVNSKTK